MSRPADILLVEDNALNRVLVRDLLEHRGHTIREAAGADEAWEQIQRARPDLVLLDVQIPGGGGETLVARIRGDGSVAGLPIIAVTAFAMPGDRERLLAAGFDDYIEKPIDTRAFGPRVESLLGKERT